MISYEDFQKIEIISARIISAEKVEGSSKLLKIIVDDGLEKRQIIAGIAKHYSPDDLSGKSIAIIANLEPRKIMGLESNGMLLAADQEGEPVLLGFEKEVSPGNKIR